MPRKRRTLKKRFKQREIYTAGRYHVIPLAGKWIVRRAGAKTAYARKDTREEAIETAKSIKSLKRFVIQTKDGSIETNLAIA